MTLPPVCRICITLGLLVSALLHGLAAVLALRLGLPPEPLPERPPAMISLDLDLAMFASPDNASDGGLAGESTPRPVDPETTPAAAPATASPGPPWPEPDEPQSLTQPAPGPGAEPRSSPKVTHASQPKKTRLIPSQVQKPRPEPRPKPNPERASEPRRRVPPTPTPPRESVRTPSDLRPAEPRPLVERKAPTDRPGAPLRTAPGSPRAERSVTADSGPSPAARASAERTYLADLRRAIAGHQRFPEEARRRHATGVATVAFVVQANGQIDQVRIGQSSGDPALDQAAIQTLSRLGRFRPIPSSIGRSRWPMRVPIRFNLR